jgi:hypothetical protein
MTTSLFWLVKKRDTIVGNHFSEKKIYEHNLYKNFLFYSMLHNLNNIILKKISLHKNFNFILFSGKPAEN